MKLNSKNGLYLIVSIIMFSFIFLSSFFFIEKKTLYDNLKGAAYHSESFLPKNYHAIYHSEKGISQIQYISFLQDIKKYSLIGQIDLLYFVEYRDGGPIISLTLPKTAYQKQNPYETTHNIRVARSEYVSKAMKLSKMRGSKKEYRGIITANEEKFLAIVNYNTDFAGNKYAIVVGYSLDKVINNFFIKYSLIMGVVLGALFFTLTTLAFFFNKQKKHEIISASDELTGFYTRKYLSKVEKKIATSNIKCWGVIYSDLDGLKKINDSEGHQAGDEYILKFSTVLKEILRHEDIVIRMGGDEFLIVTPLEEPDNIRVIVGRLKKISSYEINFSLGWETFSKKEAMDTGFWKIIERADKKMYEDKRKRNKVIFS